MYIWVDNDGPGTNNLSQKGVYSERDTFLHLPPASFLRAASVVCPKDSFKYCSHELLTSQSGTMSFFLFPILIYSLYAYFFILLSRLFISVFNK